MNYHSFNSREVAAEGGNHLGLQEDSAIAGYVGSIARTRELGFLLDGFARLNGSMYRRWFMVFVGDGDDLTTLKRAVIRWEINDITFLGDVSFSRHHLGIVRVGP